MRKPLNLALYPSQRIEQGYVATEHNGNEVRLRKKGEQYYLTVKQGVAVARSEYEVELSFDQFDVLWATTLNRRLVKTRFYIPYQRYTLELDVYAYHLIGLHTVEVEFPTVAAFNNFEPPDWFGREITDDPNFKNRHLAVHGLPTI